MNQITGPQIFTLGWKDRRFIEDESKFKIPAEITPPLHRHFDFSLFLNKMFTSQSSNGRRVGNGEAWGQPVARRWFWRVFLVRWLHNQFWGAVCICWKYNLTRSVKQDPHHLFPSNNIGYVWLKCSVSHKNAGLCIM